MNKIIKVLLITSFFCVTSGGHKQTYGRYSNHRRVSYRYPSSGSCYYHGQEIPCTILRAYRRSHHTTPKPYYKVTTTIDPDRARSDLIRERYIAARNISGGNLFAFTEKDAGDFTSRIFDEVVSDPLPTCQRQLPPFTDCKLQELAFILKNSPCQNTTNASGTDSGSEDLTPTITVGMRRRKRRSIEGQTFTNADGSTTRVIRCEERGARTRNNLLLTCRRCSAVTTLPATR